METRTLPANPDALTEAAQLLHQGKLVAFPTETVYGLGGLAENLEAVRAIFSAKGRPSTDPLILHLSQPDLSLASADGWVASPLPEAALRLAKVFWPGPLTLILRRGPKVHPEITAGLDTVAVRCPAHPAAQELLQKVGVPLAAPSANRFGRISPTDAEAVRQELNGIIPLILDGGPCALGLESTVVNLVGRSPEILRPGAVTQAQLAKELGQQLVSRQASLKKHEVQPAPGQLVSHYAPQTPLYLCEAPIKNLSPGAFHIFFRKSHQPTGGKSFLLGAEGNLDSAARELYRALRKADSSGAKKILIEPVPEGAWAEAIRDRLGRASSGTAHWDGGAWKFFPKEKP
ncbi:threonylcarbamoyl-AMP synthase [bacterium]|nr:threonylcarbamoyl-AMP synthase [bacterium]NDA09335.1 threonylcarbamoyl-AMP synthase [Verrucomicrobiota bacterium]